MPRTQQLSEFEAAFDGFVHVVESLTPQQFLAPLGNWTARDIVAHLVGWNRNVLVGCQQIQSGLQPFYHVDGPNDYRKLNAEITRRFNSTDRPALLRELAKGKDLLVSYLDGVDDREWDKDFGVTHYRGGPATIGRALESLTADYVNHAGEISSQILEPAGSGSTGEKSPAS